MKYLILIGGMGGSGKTTLAKKIYKILYTKNKYYLDIDHLCNKKNYKQNFLLLLQNALNKKMKYIIIVNSFGNSNSIKSYLK